MLLQYLVETLAKTKTRGDLNIQINKIEYNSDKIETGDLFVAISGMNEDGHDYIETAIQKGAAAIIVEEDKLDKVSGEIAVIAVENSRIALAEVAARFYDYPANKLRIIGITGTKGKTTTAYMVRDIMLAGNKKIGMIGTIYNTYAIKK